MGSDRTRRSVPNPIELVVTDLDSTLWDQATTALHRRTRDAITELKVRGIPLLVATGRRVGSTQAPLAAHGLAPAAVVLNGALGLDLASGRRFHRGGFSAADAAAVLASFAEHEIEPCVYVDHELKPVRVGAWPSTHPDHLASFGDDVAGAALDEVVAQEHVLAFAVIGLAEEVAQRLGSSLALIATPHVSVDRHYGNFTATVAPTNQSKWDGVAAFCNSEGINSEMVLAIGDGPNDIELLDKAAVAVVPEDAHPDAARRADHVVGRAAEGGWADILDLI